MPRSAALRAGKKVTGAKWLGINKGDALAANVRSRLVAKELRAFAPWIPQEDLFAATPPGAALNLLLSTMGTRKSRRGPGRAGGKPYKMAFLDVRRAFFRAAATETVFIELPEEGTTVSKDDEIVVIESVKAASDIMAPVDGEITEVNDAIVDEPGKVNEDPMGDAWFFKIKPSDPSQMDELMDEAAYQQFIS